MADRRRKEYSYIEGNTVRQEQYYHLEQQEERRSYRARKNQEKASYMTLPYVVVLALACVVVLVMAVNYIQVRSSVNIHQNTIQGLEENLAELRTDNDSLQAKIDASTDFEYIYQVATQEMGMVFPNQDQLIVYEKVESEYVRQNENIPD